MTAAYRNGFHLNGKNGTHAKSNGRVHLPMPLLSDRRPPQNLEAERSVLGCILLDNRAADEVAPILHAAEFYRDPHRTVFEVMQDMIALGQPVDGVSLAEELTRRGIYDKLGGDDLLAELVDAVPHAANAAYYAGIVHEKAVGRELIDICSGLINDGYSGEFTADELLAQAERRIFAIAERGAGGRVVDMATAVGEALERIRRRQAGEVDGLATGFEDLDDLVGAFVPGQLIMLAARPSIGKTACGMGIASNVGAATGRPPLFCSLEMDYVELAERYLSAWAEINSHAFRQAGKLGEADDRGNMDGDGWRTLMNAAGRLSRLPMRIDDTTSVTMHQLAASARRLKRSHDMPLLVVDYLGLVDGEKDRREGRHEEVARIGRGLKRLARELHIPVLALHQLNRNPESRDDRRPRMADLRDSGSLEQDAHVVMLLHRPEFYDPADEPGVAHVIVAKNRNGPTGAVKLAFQKAWTRFDSLSRHEEPPIQRFDDERPF